MNPCVRRASLLLLSLFAGCRADEFERAPIEARHAWGVVRGYTAEDVEEVGRAAEELGPRVEAWMRPDRTRPLRIVVVPHRPEDRAVATTVENVSPLTSNVTPRFIVLRVDPPGPRRYLLAHELVHWNSVGVWQRLPIAVEEGMADMIADRVEPELGLVREAFLGRLGEPREEDVREMLAVPRGEERKLELRRHDMLYLVGRNIAHRIGVDGLRAWCEDAEKRHRVSIPNEWIQAGRAAP